MSDFLFYAAVVGFCLGIIAGTFVQGGVVVATWLLGLALVLGLVWRRGGEAAASSVFLLVLSVGFVASAVGLLRAEFAVWQFAQSELVTMVDREVDLTGTIVREPDIRERTQHLYVRMTDTDETILIFTDRYSSFTYGDHVAITGTLELPESFETDLGRTFNYPGYLKAQGVQYLVSYGSVVVTGEGGGNLLVRNLLHFKQLFMRQIEALIPEPQVGLGEGLLLGVKQALGDELEQVFRTTGIIHIVVLSGYNIALVVLFIRYLLAFVFPFRVQLVVGVLGIIAFALLVGLSATVVRASLMASFILLAKYLGRTYVVVRGLMIAGLIMLMLNPYLLIYDVGFQLSFLATLGLILLAPQIERWFTWMPTALKLREFLLATIATQIFVLPILLYQIGEFSVVSVLVNVLVLPMVPIAMLLTFLTGLVSFVSTTLAVPLVYLTSWSLSYILQVATWFASVPFAAYVVPAFPFWFVPIAYGFLAYLLWRLQLPAAKDKSEFADWIIEDESVLKERLKAQSSKTEKDTPVFFS